jgi:hypothetical protein
MEQSLRAQTQAVGSIKSKPPTKPHSSTPTEAPRVLYRHHIDNWWCSSRHRNGHVEIMTDQMSGGPLTELIQQQAKQAAFHETDAHSDKGI